MFSRVSVIMWRLLVAAVLIVSLGEAQRSSYAPRPGSNSKLLPRFRKNQTTTQPSIGAREGEENVNNSALSPEFQGTLEDDDFVHRVSQWPAERQPFWFKNRYAISSMRGRDIDGGNVNQPAPGNNQRPQPQFQSSFQRPQPQFQSSFQRPQPQFQSSFQRPTSSRSSPNVIKMISDHADFDRDELLHPYQAYPLGFYPRRSY